jgi:hypothetical protein
MPHKTFWSIRSPNEKNNFRDNQKVVDPKFDVPNGTTVGFIFTTRDFLLHNLALETLFHQAQMVQARPGNRVLVTPIMMGT